MILRVNLI